MDKEPCRTAALAAQRQLNSTLHMVKALVEVCPDEVWGSCYYGFPYPVWYQVYHITFFVDFWLRKKYDGSEFRCMTFPGEDGIHKEFGGPPDPGLMIPRADMALYVEKLTGKVKTFFAGLNDEKLGQPIIPGKDLYTYEDVIVGQIRHVMYNLGYLNGILRGLDLPESDWYASEEED